jgi:tubulin polyglutamylase TTLL4
MQQACEEIEDYASTDTGDDSDGNEDCDGDEDDDDDDDEVSVSVGSNESVELLPGEVRLVPSLFPDRPATVLFEYDKSLGLLREDSARAKEPLLGRTLMYRTCWERQSVRNAFARAGFLRTSSSSWTASWGKHPSAEDYQSLNRFQKVNHFPGSWCLGRKDRLMRTLGRKRREGLRAGAAYDFLPSGYLLPRERRAWLRACDADPGAMWILKPPASSCGRGVRLLRKGQPVPRGKKCILQKYLSSPLLIEGRKVDLRLYVLVTSMEPLRVYVFREGLARFSTQKYSLSSRSRFAHLTNYSVNKKSVSYVTADESSDVSASKWSLSAFWAHIDREYGVERARQAREKVNDIIVKTVIAADPDMSTSQKQQLPLHRGSCFEMFGFDVMLDASLRPWLLEVNVSPSLYGSSPLDKRIKGMLMADVFHLVGFRPFDKASMKLEAQREQSRLPGTRRFSTMKSKPQNAWRRNPVPSSVDLCNLSEDEWELIRDMEDELSRRGHFDVLWPSIERIPRLWACFSSPRFLNGVAAKWILSGGLQNKSNALRIGYQHQRGAAPRHGSCSGTDSAAETAETQVESSASASSSAYSRPTAVGATRGAPKQRRAESLPVAPRIPSSVSAAASSHRSSLGKRVDLCIEHHWLPVQGGLALNRRRSEQLVGRPTKRQ